MECGGKTLIILGWRLVEEFYAESRVSEQKCSLEDILFNSSNESGEFAGKKNGVWFVH